jgi:hypothetical protein
LRLDHAIPPAAEARAVPSDTPAHNLGGDVHALEVGDADTAVVRTLTVEFAPQGPAVDQLDHHVYGSVAAVILAKTQLKVLEAKSGRATEAGVLAVIPARQAPPGHLALSSISKHN